MMRGIAFLLVASALLFLVGCTERTTFDDSRFNEYRSFLDYSLGDFRIVRESTARDLQGEPQFGMRSTRWTVWELEYQRQDGETRSFTFDNRFSMGAHLIGATSEIMQEEISDIISNNLKLRPFTNAPEITPTFRGAVGVVPSRTSIVVSLDIGLEGIEDTDILNPETGIQLYSVTTQSLMDNFYLDLISIAVRQPHVPDFSRTRDIFGVVRPLVAYVGQTELVAFSFESSPTSANSNYTQEVRFTGYYNLQNDTFVFHEVQGRTNHPSRYAITAREFLRIVEFLAEHTEQDKIKVDFRFTFGPEAMETLSVDWSWFHDMEYYCRQADSFILEAE